MEKIYLLLKKLHYKLHLIKKKKALRWNSERLRSLSWLRVYTPWRDFVNTLSLCFEIFTFRFFIFGKEFDQIVLIPFI